MGLKVLDKDYMTPYYHIVQIGAGANGSHFFRSLCQDVATYGAGKKNFLGSSRFEIDIYLVDEDKVEKKNLDNQLFDEEDIDEYKVDALRERYAEHYNIRVQSVPKYVTDIETMQSLFKFPKKDSRIVPILIGMVDNNATRQLMDEFFHSDYLEDLIYIDAGVEGVFVVPGKNERQFTDEEKAQAARSGFSGQAVVGFKKKGQVWLEPYGRLYDDVLTDENTAFPNQSCGEVIINNPQRCATNKFAAQIANNLMNTLFHTKTIETHHVTFNAQFCGARPEFVSKTVKKEYNEFRVTF